MKIGSIAPEWVSLRFFVRALEMFKTVGVTGQIAEKQFVFDLLRSYNEIARFDGSLHLNDDPRKEMLPPLQ